MHKKIADKIRDKKFTGEYQNMGLTKSPSIFYSVVIIFVGLFMGVRLRKICLLTTI